MKRYKVLFCDLDGTLIEPKTKNRFPEGIWDMQFKFNVFDAIKKMKPECIFIVANQGAVGQYFTEEQFEAKLNYVLECLISYIEDADYQVIAYDSIYCTSNDKADPFRKPNPGMLQYIWNAFRMQQKYVMDDLIMIGDASGLKGNPSKIDIECANNFGIHYCDVNEFTKINKFEDYEQQ